jgi:glycosyltransferase involved in cell wall biosynthesis
MTTNGDLVFSSKNRPLNLAFFSPLPPAKTGIVDYSLELLPYLAEQAQVTVFITGPTIVPAQLIGSVNILSTRVYPERRWQYDMSLYQMGNDGQNHEAIYRLALKYPGIVVFHDLTLHQFIADATIGQNDHASYAQEFGYASGSKGYDQAWDIRLGLEQKPEYELMLNNRLMDRSLGLIVHSEFAARKLRNYRSDRPIQVVPKPQSFVKGRSRRVKLGIEPKTVVFASVGGESRQFLDKALAAFSRLLKVNPDVFYLIVGGGPSEFKLNRLIHRNPIRKAIKHTGHIDSQQDFSDLLATSDVVLDLRDPIHGETSGSAMGAMAAGKPLIVFDYGWYKELPDDVCLKVDPADSESLFQAMLTLASDEEKRVTMGLAARNYIGDRHQPRHSAKTYSSFIRAVINNLAQAV